MGTPSSQPARRVEDILRDLVRDPERKLSEEDARRVGVDIDIVEAMYESEIRPYLDYLAGYRDLLELDPIPAYCRGRNKVEGWEDVLGRHGQLNRHTQTLQLLHNQMYWYSREQAGAAQVWITVYLTRKGTWLFRYAEGREQTMPVNERVSSYDTVRELCATLTDLVSDDYKFEWRGYNLPGFIPLSIEERLRHVLAKTIEERQKRLESMQNALASANRRVKGIVLKS